MAKVRFKLAPLTAMPPERIVVPGVVTPETRYVDRVVEKVVDRVVHVDRPVEVVREVVKYVDRVIERASPPVIQEVVVEKVVERVVHVDRPVDREVLVDREVIVDRATIAAVAAQEKIVNKVPTWVVVAMALETVALIILLGAKL